MESPGGSPGFLVVTYPIRGTICAGLTAVHRQDDACDPSGFITGEERNSRCYFLRLAGASQRDMGPRFFQRA